MEETNKPVAEQILDASDKMSARLSEVGRQVVLAIIAGAWAVSYSNSVFSPSRLIVWSLALAFLYLFMDLLYYLITRIKYFRYIRLDKEEAELKLTDEEDNIIRSQMNWKIGSVWFVCFKTVILLVSAILIFIHVIIS